MKAMLRLAYNYGGAFVKLMMIIAYRSMHFANHYFSHIINWHVYKLLIYHLPRCRTNMSGQHAFTSTCYEEIVRLPLIVMKYL